MVFATGTGDGLGFERHHFQIVGESPPGGDRIEALHQFGVLRRDAGGVLALVPVVIGAGRRAELLVFFLPARVIVTDGDQRRGTNRHRIGSKRQGLGDIRTGANTPGHDELNLAVHGAYDWRNRHR